MGVIISCSSVTCLFILAFIFHNVETRIVPTVDYDKLYTNTSIPAEVPMYNMTSIPMGNYSMNYTMPVIAEPSVRQNFKFKRLQRPPVDQLPYHIRGDIPDPLEIPIKFTIYPTYLERVDSRLATCRIHVFVVMEWMDQRIAWDPQKFGVPGGIRINPKNIWTPDLQPYNAVKGDSSKWLDYARAHVSPNGKVRLSQFFILSTFGQRSRGLFLPVCDMRFGSWTAGRFKIINNNNVDFSRYSPNMRWSLQKQEIKIRYESGFPEIRAKITFMSRV